MENDSIIRIKKNVGEGYSFYAGWTLEDNGTQQEDTLGHFYVLKKDEINIVRKYVEKLKVMPEMIGLSIEEKGRITRSLKETIARL